MEFVIGPLAAVLVAIGCGKRIRDDHKVIISLDERVKVLESVAAEQENKIMGKTLKTMVPFVQAVNELKQQVGIQ